MIILGGDGGAEVQVSSDGSILVSVWNGSNEREARAFFDQNHAEALETALRAARLEVQARAVSR